MSPEPQQIGNASAASAPTVSLCIPAHGRPGFLLEALESATAQTHPPDEILVSDDLDNKEIRELVSTFARRQPFPVRYRRCTTGPGLAHNINSCFMGAECDLVLLLHDDDLLMPRAIEALRRPFLANQEIVGAYGKQMLMTEVGEEQFDASERLNRDFGRSAAAAGLQRDGVLCGIRQQFPNDGYLVRASVARQVLQKHEFGAASEVDFGIRMGDKGPFFFVDEYTAKYRFSRESIGRGMGRRKDDSAYQTMRICFQMLESRPGYRNEIEAKLRRFVPIGIGTAINIGRLEEATAWYFGPYHRGRIATPGGLHRGIRIAGGWLKHGLSKRR